MAEEIVRHIGSLDPPGRFLKREGRGQITRGLNGPWEELSHKEAVKKATQALRDCNRHDRKTYAEGVVAPEDVQAVFEERKTSGISGLEYAEKARVLVQEETQAQLREAMAQAGIPEEQIEEQLKRQEVDPTYVIPGFAMTSNGTFQPMGANIPIGGMHSIGPDGLPVIEGGVSVSIDPATLYSQVIPPVEMQVPHPLFEVGEIDMEAAREARKIAGYRHPTLDPPEDEVTEENAELKADVAAAQEAAAAVAGMETDHDQQALITEIAEDIVQDTTEAMAQDPAEGAMQVQAEDGAEEGAKQEDLVQEIAQDQVVEDDIKQEEGTESQENVEQEATGQEEANGGDVIV